MIDVWTWGNGSYNLLSMDEIQDKLISNNYMMLDNLSNVRNYARDELHTLSWIKQENKATRTTLTWNWKQRQRETEDEGGKGFSSNCWMHQSRAVSAWRCSFYHQLSPRPTDLAYPRSVDIRGNEKHKYRFITQASVYVFICSMQGSITLMQVNIVDTNLHTPQILCQVTLNGNSLLAEKNLSQMMKFPALLNYMLVTNPPSLCKSHDYLWNTKFIHANLLTFKTSSSKHCSTLTRVLALHSMKRQPDSLAKSIPSFLLTTLSFSYNRYESYVCITILSKNDALPRTRFNRLT